MKRFKTVTFESKTVLAVDGMEINSYIAGVNSGMYGLPFVISVRCWARKWFFSKFFCREMKLNLKQVRELRDELDFVINQFHNEQV